MTAVASRSRKRAAGDGTAETLAEVVPLRTPVPARGEAAEWWATHDRGTNDRPAPGTRLRLVDGRTATVLPYEGCWPSWTFPARIDGSAVQCSLATGNIDTTL